METFIDAFHHEPIHSFLEISMRFLIKQCNTGRKVGVPYETCVGDVSFQSNNPELSLILEKKLL